ncbi:MAG TPA: aldo/keto reductase [Methanomassiliicoccales archaeon]|nr:aldo/keto reductase [Methanomassiliicoccales archaeon]
MGILDESYRLENGVRVPKIGLGTWHMPDGRTTYDAVSFALANGYRHIDTAHGYGNEASVGSAVRDCGIERKEIFVTSKLPADVKNYEGALKSFEGTMERLGLEYLDLYLIHAPWPWNKAGLDFRAENSRVWKALEMIYKSGRCRAIGVSNFDISDLTSLIQDCEIEPMANQIKFHVGNTQESLTRYCQQNRMLVEGYSPLATGAILGDDAIAAVAEKYDSTVAKICIRYVLQRGVLPLPKSVHPEYILQNADVDFEIRADDMALLDNMKNTAREGRVRKGLRMILQ